VYFTREPLIETIISPREGYKLILRSSKHEGSEEFCVDSVEVITFGNHCFYRSLDRSETFLLPVFDYEIVEARSQRLTLKTSTSQDKEIKIGKPKETRPGVEEKKKEKRPSRKKKEKPKAEVAAEEPTSFPAEPAKAKPEQREFIQRELIPPPSSLISDTISRYELKPADEAIVEEEQMIELPSVQIIEPPEEEESNELPSGNS